MLCYNICRLHFTLKDRIVKQGKTQTPSSLLLCMTNGIDTTLACRRHHHRCHCVVTALLSHFYGLYYSLLWLWMSCGSFNSSSHSCILLSFGFMLFRLIHSLPSSLLRLLHDDDFWWWCLSVVCVVSPPSSSEKKNMIIISLLVILLLHQWLLHFVSPLFSSLSLLWLHKSTQESRWKALHQREKKNKDKRQGSMTTGDNLVTAVSWYRLFYEVRIRTTILDALLSQETREKTQPKRIGGEETEKRQRRCNLSFCSFRSYTVKMYTWLSCFFVCPLRW